MTDDRRAYVDRVFDEALALPDEQRPGFLARLSVEDGALAAELSELLRLASEPAPRALEPGALLHGLLHGLIAEVERTDAGTLAVGARVGIWRVVSELGRGGMGTVYLVERDDGEFKQRGALKLVRSALASDEIARRLRRERQILASLTHANIARLLDGGQTEDGRPYFVMEYVEGWPIDRYCDDRRLTIAERLDLLVRVCSGVQHAHSRLVVHRDVKPANIIVTAERDVKLLDFGIARLLAAADPAEDDAPTQPAMRILTPEYASPEQIRGEAVTIASDVYQLGLLLYELLTGSRAQTITSAAPAALERAICDTPAVPPSVRVAGVPPAVAAARRLTPAALVRTLTGDLDTIVLYALRKESDRRYASASELLNDLMRYRAGLPVHAQVDTLRYRTRKFVARHRTALVWAAALLLALAVGLPAVITERLRASRESSRAAQVEQLLIDVFALPNPRMVAQPPQAVDYVDQATRLVRTALTGEPRTQARLLTRAGRVYNALGYYDRSIEVLEDALKLRRQAFGADSGEVADTLEWLGQSQHYAGRYDQAESIVRQALDIRRLRLGAIDPDTIRTTLELGDLLHTRGKLLDAERTLREAVTVLRANARAARPEDLGHDSLPRALRDLANVLRDRGQFDESAKLFAEAIETFRALYGDSNQQLAASRVYFSRLLIMRSQFDAAESAIEYSIRVLRRIYDGDHALVGMALREWGHLRIEQGRLDEAEVLLNDAQGVLQTWLGETHPQVPRTRAHQAELALRRGQTVEAVRLATLTLDEFARLDMREHPSAIDARATLGRALSMLGRHTDASRELAAAAASAERQFVTGDPRIERLRQTLARDINF